MKKYYKLTDEKMQTHGGYQWELGKAAKTSGEGELCSAGWIYCYHHPFLAVLLNPIHANFDKPRLFEANVGGKHLDDHGLKIGWTEVMLVKELPIPQITTEQRVKFAILCALKVCDEKGFLRWARDWLSGKDRTKKAAEVAEVAAGAAAGAAAQAAQAAAGAAAWGAARAARAAAGAADEKINLIALAKKAMKIERER